MSLPGVSIVVPTRGRAELVEELLATLAPARATYPGPSEIVLCDASTGPDRERIARAAAEVGARLERSTPGVARQRNVGVTAAVHALVWFVDSDCRAMPGALPALVAALGPGAVAAAGAVALTGSPSLLVDAARRTGVVAAFDGFGAPAGNALPWAVTANLLVRRDAFQAVDGCDEGLSAGEDVDLGIRLARSGAIRWVPAAVVHHDVRTWDTPLTALRRFWSYGAADAHLLVRHQHLRGRVEPSIVNAAPLAVAVAVAVATTRSPGAVASRVALWSATALVALVVTARPRTPRDVITAGASALLVECLHGGRQLEAVRRRHWRTLWAGVVLDAGQRERERARTRRTGVALLVAAPAMLLRRPR